MERIVPHRRIAGIFEPARIVHRATIGRPRRDSAWFNTRSATRWFRQRFSKYSHIGRLQSWTSDNDFRHLSIRPTPLRRTIEEWTDPPASLIVPTLRTCPWWITSDWHLSTWTAWYRPICTERPWRISVKWPSSIRIYWLQSTCTDGVYMGGTDQFITGNSHPYQLSKFRGRFLKKTSFWVNFNQGYFNKKIIARFEHSNMLWTDMSFYVHSSLVWAFFLSFESRSNSEFMWKYMASLPQRRIF